MAWLSRRMGRSAADRSSRSRGPARCDAPIAPAVLARRPTPLSTNWETLFGDTSRFAVRLGFEADSSEVEVEPEVAASWGSLELWVNGANLCTHLEQGETLEAVHWYLLPFLEWIVEQWNPLFHEERLPV